LLRRPPTPTRPTSSCHPLDQARFFDGSGDGTGGVAGTTLLTWGMAVCLAGLAFGLVIYEHLRKLPVHKSMLDVSS
jgi:hypothetical protein